MPLIAAQCAFRPGYGAIAQALCLLELSSMHGQHAAPYRHSSAEGRAEQAGRLNKMLLVLMLSAPAKAQAA